MIDKIIFLSYNRKCKVKLNEQTKNIMQAQVYYDYWLKVNNEYQNIGTFKEMVNEENRVKELDRDFVTEVISVNSEERLLIEENYHSTMLNKAKKERNNYLIAIEKLKEEEDYHLKMLWSVEKERDAKKRFFKD